MLTVRFPENNSFHPMNPKLDRTYIISIDGLEIIDSDGSKKDIRCPDYVKRVYIKQDISLMALKYGISKDLIISYDKDNQRILGRGRVSKLLRRPKSKEQQELETKLNDLVIAFLSNNEYQVTDDIADGFSILIKGLTE